MGSSPVDAGYSARMRPVVSALARLGGRLARTDIAQREALFLGAAMVAALGLALAHAIATKDYSLVGDERFYNAQARLFADGHYLQSVFPLTELHETAWKTPGYPVWIGTLYTVLGESPTKVGAVQALVLAPMVVLLTWVLARRLFDATVAIVAAAIVAVMPLIWESYAMLLPEALAIPVTLLALILILSCEPSGKIAAWTGVTIGLAILIRPNSLFLLVGALVVWLMVLGARRGVTLAAVATGCAILVVLPWSIRNQIVTDGFVPLSVQDAAGYGTFNDEAASDSENPYAWRASLANGTEPAILADPQPGVTEAEIRSNLTDLMFDYIGEHPDSVPKAFFWNGIIRLWDLRSPDDALGVVGFSAHSRPVHLTGLIGHWLILPFVLIGLWQLRRRPRLLVPILAMLFALAVSCTVVATTRYRLPVEPLLIIIAASTLPLSWRKLNPQTVTPAGPSLRLPERAA